MTMESLNLLPPLQKLPGGNTGPRKSCQELLNNLKGVHPTERAPVVPPYYSINGATDGLNTLSRGLGLPLTYDESDIKSYAADIIASLPLICRALENGNRFNQVDRTALNEANVVGTLTLMSQLGIKTILQSVRSADNGAFKTLASKVGEAAGKAAGTMVGRAAKKAVSSGFSKFAGKLLSTAARKIPAVAGAAAGTPVPAIGNAAGAVAGFAIGVAVDKSVRWAFGGLKNLIVGDGDSNSLIDYLNQHLQPHMLDLALNIAGLDHDDLFYYKNKVRIDEVAFSIRQTAGQLE